MTCRDEPPAPFPDPALAPIEVEAMLALGRLDGALGTCSPTTLRLLAARILRDLLTTALRQEGHAFTEQRFHAWFAGLATLSDHPPREMRPPRTLCEAVLTELAHSTWEPIADLAAQFSSALLAPSDLIVNAAPGETGHEDAHAIVTAARALIAQLEPSLLPLVDLAGLHRAAGQHLLFAEPERAFEPVSLGLIRLTIERAALPSPRWALEMLWGEHWRAAELVTHALPFPGLVRLDALRADSATGEIGPGDLRIILATALRDVAQDLRNHIAEADQLARRLEDLRPGRRSSSRAPALLELLAGFGPMRSAQLETLLGATRLGVRAMLTALGDIGVLERTTLAGVHLFSVDLGARPTTSDRGESPANFGFTSAALNEYNASMADIDALLARRGVSLDDADTRDEP